MKPNWAFRVRVLVLSSVLAIVVIYAAHDIAQRRSRTDWTRTLEVAVVLLELEPVAASAKEGFRTRLGALEEALGAEARRHRPGIPKPFDFTAFGSVEVTKPPPDLEGDGFLALLGHTYRQWRYVSAVDSAAGVESGAYDARLYVTLRKPKDGARTMVEGSSQQGGRIGQVTVELDESMVDLALMVVAHELFHTLGALDKYDSQGRVLVPSGLAEPDKTPLYPQEFAEIMARNRPVSRLSEVVPDALDELRVGAQTAREIGWLSP